jgi:hypothetical protein
MVSIFSLLICISNKIYCHVFLYAKWPIFITKSKNDVDNFAQGPTIVLNNIN